MAKEQLPVNEYGRVDYTKSKNPIVRWVANYWYYYRAPVLIIGFLLILAIWFVVDIVTKVDSDMRVIMVSDTLMLEEESDAIQAAAGKFATDVNGDGQVHVTSTYLNLAEEPEDEYQLAAYDQVITFMIDDNIAFYIVDHYSYTYLQLQEMIPKLSEFGIEYDGHEYRIPINDTFLMADTKELSERGDLYFVMKAAPVKSMEEEENVKRYADAVELANALISDLESKKSADQ